MKYFVFDGRRVQSIVIGNGINDTYMSTSEAQPVTLSPAVIREKIEIIKKNKEEFKKLILNFDKLEDSEKLSIIYKFYAKWYQLLESNFLEECRKEYPVSKVLKTNLVVETESGCFFKANATVYAKKGVMLNPLKTYKKQELDKLIEDGKIIIVYATIRGSQIARPSVVENLELYVERFCPEFEKLSADQICENFPSVKRALLSDISLEELKVDYETCYLPAYKASLKYLAGCAKASNVLEEQKRKKLKQQREESNEKSRQFAEIQKEIRDASKGR